MAPTARSVCHQSAALCLLGDGLALQKALVICRQDSHCNFMLQADAAGAEVQPARDAQC